MGFEVATTIVGDLASGIGQEALADASDAVRLAEFNSLHQEIGQRSTIQQALVALSLTVATSVSGLVAAGSSREELFLAVPFASCTFGLLWLDHHLSIHQIGSYLDRDVCRWQPSWESHVRSQPKPGWWRAIYLVAMMLAFLGVAVAAVVIAAADVSGRARILWWGATGLTLFCTLAFLVVFLSGPGRLK